MNKKGFTLVELLVVVVILGIIAGLSIPLLRNLTASFDKNKYKTYSDSVLYAAKLYNDSYSEDLFGHNEYGCCYVTYDDLAEKRLINDIEIDGVSCNSDLTYVRIIKQKDSYAYVPYITCGKKTNNRAGTTIKTLPEEVPELNPEACTCSNKSGLSVTADMTESGSHVTNRRRKTKVIITSGTGISSVISMYAKWSKSWEDYNEEGFERLDFKVSGNQEERLAKGEIITTKSKELLTPKSDGEYYLIVRVDHLEDIYGNEWTNPDTSTPDSKYLSFGPFYVEGYVVKGEVGVTLENTSKGEWTNKDVHVKITGKSITSVLEKYTETYDASNEESFTKIEEAPVGVLTSNFSRTYTGQTAKKLLTVRAYNIDGEYGESSTWIRIDKTPPTKPTIVNSSKEAWVKTTVNLRVSSSDQHSGIEGYYYSYKANATEKGNDPNTSWVLMKDDRTNTPCDSEFKKAYCQQTLPETEVKAGEVFDKIVYIRVYDKATNYADNSTKIRIDKARPVITKITNPKENTWTNSEIKIPIKATEEGSGIGKYYWTTSSTASIDNNNSWKQLTECKAEDSCTSKWSGERNNTVYIKVCDKATNCSEKVSTVIKIDKTKPTCSVSKTKTGTSGVSTKVTCKDTKGSAHSGVEDKKCPDGDSGLTSNKTYSATDRAGNKGTCTVKVNKSCTKWSCHAVKGKPTPNYGVSKSSCHAACKNMYKRKNATTYYKCPSGGDHCFYDWWYFEEVSKTKINNITVITYEWMNCDTTKTAKKTYIKYPKHYPQYESDPYKDKGCCWCCDDLRCKSYKYT